MSNNNLIDEFLEFEYNNNLFEKEIQGIKFWSIMRIIIYNEILKQKDNFGEAHTTLSKESFIKRVLLKFKQLFNFIFKNPLIGLNKRDILVFNHHRRVKNGKYYDCLYTDKLLENIDYSYYVFEQPYLEMHYRPVKTKNIKYMDYINFLQAIEKRILKLFKVYNLSSKEVIEITQLIDNINKLFNVNLDKSKLVEQLQNYVLTYKCLSKYYSKILDKVKPKIIIEVVSYGFDRIIINDLAKKRGIKIIELQHGTMGKYHIAYNFYKKTKLVYFPDYIFVFGSYWKDNTRFPIDKKNILVTGFPYLEKKIQSLIISKSNKKQTILFISQGTIGKKLSKLAVELYKKIDSKKFNIIYKLHPGEYDRWKDEYPWLLDTNIEVIDDNQYDIYYYFSKSDCQIGVYSTAIIEGLAFNLKTFIYKTSGYEYMECLYSKGYAHLVTSIDDIIIKLDCNNNKKSEQTCNLFWQQNSIDKIKKNIKNIINN